MGISPFKTRYDLLLEKANLKEDEFEGNEYTEYGNIMEEKIRNYINLFYYMDFKEGKVEKDDIRCHFDGIDENKKVILEIKTTSQIHEQVNDYKIYLVQLLFYMMNANIESGMLAVYKRPDNFNETFDKEKLHIFNIEIKDYKDLCIEIMEAVEQFRYDLQRLKANPFLTEQELINNDIVVLANKVVKLEERLKLYDDIIKERDKIKAELKETMQKYKVKGWEMPNGTKITLVNDTPNKKLLKFNEKKFKEENELIYNKYLEEKEQKGKSGYVLITLGGKNEEN